VTVVIADSGPLIALREIDRLDLLQVLFGRVTIPIIVAREVAPTIPKLPGWIDVERSPVGGAPGEWTHLDDGERAALLLARAMSARLVVIDDLDGRNAAIRSGLAITGTAGVLLLAKRAGLVAEVWPLLDQLSDAGFYLGREIRRSVLAAADEDAETT
jgi:predicted nucleic acid-binding protein